jgi:hypothetical protein
MLLFRILIVWVLLQATSYVRDIFNLPLHDGRTFLIDAYILMFCLCLFVLNQALKYRTSLNKDIAENNVNHIMKYGAQSQPYSNVRALAFNAIDYLISTGYNFIGLFKKIPISYTFLICIPPGFFIYVSSKINESAQLFYFKQYLLFVILIQLLFWTVRYGRIDSLFNVVLNGSILFTLIQTLLFGLNIIHDGAYQDLIIKNAFPIAMLIMSEICKGVNKNGMSKRFLVIGTISAIISSTKLFFVIILAAIAINFLINNHVKSLRGRGLVLLPWYLFLLFSPFLFPLVIEFLFDLEINDLIEIGADRYYIDDNIASLVSRVYSVVYIFSQENILAIFGSGESAMSNIIFWGYPVHNIYASLVYAHGALVLWIFVLYHFMIYRFLCRNPGLCTILGFVLIYFNDIYPMMSLLFIPTIIRNNKIWIRKKSLDKR